MRLNSWETEDTVNSERAIEAELGSERVIGAELSIKSDWGRVEQ